MKITITSDGTGAGTTVVDSETGADVVGIVALDITIRPNAIVTAKMQTFVSEEEIADADLYGLPARATVYAAHPLTTKIHPVERIVFADGTPDWVPAPAEEKAKADG